MRTIGALLVLGACTPGEEPVAEWGEVDGAALLDPLERPARAFPDRVAPLGVPRAPPQPHGPDLTRPGWGDEELVVVDPTPWPRVTLDARDVRVLLYVERGALQQRVVAPVDGTGAHGAGRVSVTARVPIEVVDEDADRVLVEAEGEHLTVWGWFPRSAVDEVYPADAPPLRPIPDGRWIGVRGGAEVLDEPGGDALARLEHDLMGTEHDERDGPWVPLALHDDGVAVEGWVHEEDLVPQMRFGRSSGWTSRCGGVGIGSGRGRPYAVVPEGTWLHAGVDGPVVGVALRDIVVPFDALGAGATLQRDTSVGEVSLWAAPEDLIPEV